MVAERVCSSGNDMGRGNCGCLAGAWLSPRSVSYEDLLPFCCTLCRCHLRGAGKAAAGLSSSRTKPSVCFIQGACISQMGLGTDSGSHVHLQAQFRREQPSGGVQRVKV